MSDAEPELFLYERDETTQHERIVRASPHLMEIIAAANEGLNGVAIACLLMRGERVFSSTHSYVLENSRDNLP